MAVHNVPLYFTGFAYASATESALPFDIGSMERVVSYVGLLVMGWFFWKRESGRTDKTNSELQAQVDNLNKENRELEREIRRLLSEK